MAMLPPVSFQGTVRHPRTGAALPYAGTCVVVVDRQGRESMHVRGSIRAGDHEAPLVVLGLTDRSRSFIGREAEAANDCVVQRCDVDGELLRAVGA